MILKRATLGLAYLFSAALVFFAAIGLQQTELLQIGFVGFVFTAWLVSSLILGVSVRNSLLFTALFFIKPIPVSFMCAVFILLFSLLFEFLQSGRKAFYIPYPAALSILLVTSIYGLVRSRNLDDSYLYFMSTAFLPLLLLVLAANSRLKKDDFLLWMRLIVVIAAILGFIGTIMGMGSPDERLGSLWVTAMTINGFYTLAFFFALALAFRATVAQFRLLWYVCALLIFLGMMYTYTRMALLAVIFGFFLMMWRMKKMRYIGMFLLLLLPLIIPSSMVSRIQLGLTFDVSIYIRLLAWYTAFQQIAQQPFFGIGISVWKEWYKGAVPIDFLYAEHPHNLILKIWIEIGIFGLLSYLYIVYAVLRKFYLSLVKPASDNFYRVVQIGVVALLFSCLSDIFVQQYSVGLVFWTTLGFLYALSRKSPDTEVS